MDFLKVLGQGIQGIPGIGLFFLQMLHRLQTALDGLQATLDVFDLAQGIGLVLQQRLLGAFHLFFNLLGPGVQLVLKESHLFFELLNLPLLVILSVLQNYHIIPGGAPSHQGQHPEANQGIASGSHSETPNLVMARPVSRLLKKTSLFRHSGNSGLILRQNGPGGFWPRRPRYAPGPPAFLFQN